jgi:hypothetical protein
MAELHLQAADDLVERLAHENDPVRAIVELIWNAIDAEAPEVTFAFERDEWEAIAKTTVSDTRYGISVDGPRPAALNQFAEYGDVIDPNRLASSDDWRPRRRAEGPSHRLDGRPERRCVQPRAATAMLLAAGSSSAQSQRSRTR